MFWVAALVFATILALFVLGSFRYRLDKNALTYGAVLVVGAAFWPLWWNGSLLKAGMAAEGPAALLTFFRHHFLTLHGLDNLVHADTMLFILGLTFFVAVIAQTRLLEVVSFSILAKTKGNVVATVAALTAVVSFASGILDGVSMIGLLIRTLVIILLLAKVDDAAVLFSVIVSTVVTTVCGMWLAYGEPPNLIMKANLAPHLTNKFFLEYCLPAAVGSYIVVFMNIRRFLKGKHIVMGSLDILDLNTADVRFIQAARHGDVLSPIEFVETHRTELGEYFDKILARLRRGEPLGGALVAEDVPAGKRTQLLSEFISDETAGMLDRHYVDMADGVADDHQTRQAVRAALESVRQKRVRTQIIGGLAFIPFIGSLVLHGMDHRWPLFVASFLGFGVAILGILPFPKIRSLALREARREYAEYLFLFPLFFSVTLLYKTGFFDQLSLLLLKGIERYGVSHMASLQYVGAVILSAMLDNNVVADFAGRAIQKFDVGLLHLFAMAQMAGYAVGGCWTHIGSAQSVVAYSFVRKEISSKFTPWQWIKLMTPIVFEIFAMMTVLIYGISWLTRT